MDDACRTKVRTVTDHMVAWLRSSGFHPAFGAELEYYLFDRDRPVDWRDGKFPFFTEDVREAAEKQGIRIVDMPLEFGKGQHEVVTGISDPVTQARWCLALKQILKDCADRHELSVDLRPLAPGVRVGSGFHVHMGLYTQDITGQAPDSLRSSDGMEEGIIVRPIWTMNRLMRGAGLANGLETILAEGLLALMTEAQAVHLPSDNALHRSFGSNDSSSSARSLTIGSGKNGRALRIIKDKSATRIESRLSAMDADPDLVMLTLVAGLVRGIEKAHNVEYVSPYQQPSDFLATHPIAPPVGNLQLTDDAALAFTRQVALPYPGHSENDTLVHKQCLAGNITSHHAHAPANDYMSYVFLTAQQLPRLAGPSLFADLAGGLTRNRDFFISPVNDQEYKWKPTLYSSTSTLAIETALSHQVRQLRTHHCTRVYADKDQSLLVLTFTSAEKRDNFLTEALGPHLTEALRPEHGLATGAMNAAGFYQPGRLPRKSDGEMPCLVVQAERMTGYLTIADNAGKKPFQHALQIYRDMQQGEEKWLCIPASLQGPHQVAKSIPMMKVEKGMMDAIFDVAKQIWTR